MTLRPHLRIYVAMAALSVAQFAGPGVASAAVQPARTDQPVIADVPATDAPPPSTQPDATSAMPVSAAPDDTDGAAYPVSAFDLAYGGEPRGVPTVDSILDEPITLGQTEIGFVVPPSLDAIYRRQILPDMAAPTAARPGVTGVTKTLRQLATETPTNYHASAIWAINYQLVRIMNARGLIGVYVSPDAADVDETTGSDIRVDRSALKLVISVGVIRNVRTIASGARIAEANKINNPAHERILALSPVRSGDVLNKAAIDDHIARLNRFSGRRVDAAIAASDQPGGVDLDYLIAERRNYTLYAQIGNTGTEQTNEWRERFGLLYAHLVKDRDDVFGIDYTTAGFEDSHAVLISYDTPIAYSDRLRLKTQAYYNQFTASDIGQAGFDFDGDEFGISVESTLNFYQRGQLFVDAFAGLRYSHYEVDNEAVGDEGSAGFIYPSIGLRAERTTDRNAFSAELSIEGGFSDADEDELDRLGRENADDTTFRATFDVGYSFYLEPVINPRGFRDDPSSQTLANELSLNVRTQWSPNSRLIAQEQRIVGGFETVRGYDEAVTAGDTTIVGSLEYRLHIPRILHIQEDPARTPLFGQPFKFSPQYAFDRPDWDLIFRSFLDVGQVVNNDRDSVFNSLESNETLVGTGIGLEFQFRENFSLRVDWGIALTDVDDESGENDTDAGDSRVHVAATFTF